jgi:hypothetical protein
MLCGNDDSSPVSPTFCTSREKHVEIFVLAAIVTIHERACGSSFLFSHIFTSLAIEISYTAPNALPPPSDSCLLMVVKVTFVASGHHNHLVFRAKAFFNRC